MAETPGLHTKVTADISDFDRKLKAATKRLTGTADQFGGFGIKVDTGSRAMRRAAAEAAKMQKAIRNAAASTRNAGSAHASLLSDLNNTAGALGNVSNRAKMYQTQANKAGIQTANIAAQFNDIGVMLAAGQSPLTLAIQQGTQLNQVFSQLGGQGKKLGPTLVAAFRQMLNPVSLLTIGLIAGGAALFQYARNALSAEGNFATLSKRLDDAREAVTELDLELDRLKAGDIDETAQAFRHSLEQAVAEMEQQELLLQTLKNAGAELLPGEKQRLEYLQEQVELRKKELQDYLATSEAVNRLNEKEREGNRIRGERQVQFGTQMLTLARQNALLEIALKHGKDSVEYQAEMNRQSVIEEKSRANIEGLTAAQISALYDAIEQQAALNTKIQWQETHLPKITESMRQTARALYEQNQRLTQGRKLATALRDAARSIKIAMDGIANADISSPFSRALGFARELLGTMQEMAKAKGPVLQPGESLGFSGFGTGGDPTPLGLGGFGDPNRPKGGFGVQGAQSTTTYNTAPGEFSPTGGAGAGGGGTSVRDQLMADLEAFRESLMTEEQLELESYERRKQRLNEFLQAELLQKQEYNELMQKAQQQHQDRMAEIDVWSHGNALQKAGAYMGALSDIFAQGNEKMVKMSKIFGAAQALIATWTGAAEALKLPFPANMAAFAQVLAQGLGAVQAIRSVTTSGGGGGSASAAGAVTGGSSAAVRQSQQVAVTLTGGELFSRDQVVTLINRINEAQEDGAIVRVV